MTPSATINWTLAESPTVFIIDDDPSIRSLLELLISHSGRRCISFENAAEFLEAYDPRRPGCVLSDILMPGMSGLDLQNELNRRGATVPVIFISAQGDVPTAVVAMRHGAFDFLLKPFSDQDLLNRVAAALARDQEIRLSLSEVDQVRTRLDRLTPREHEVLKLIVAGRSNKAMSDDLALSIRTVELHRARVMEKMRVKSVAQLVRMIMEAQGPQQPAAPH